MLEHSCFQCAVIVHCSRFCRCTLFQSNPVQLIYFFGLRKLTTSMHFTCNFQERFYLTVFFLNFVYQKDPRLATKAT